MLVKDRVVLMKKTTQVHGRSGDDGLEIREHFERIESVYIRGTI